jgi:hypothetical protein
MLEAKLKKKEAAIIIIIRLTFVVAVAVAVATTNLCAVKISVGKAHTHYTLVHNAKYSIDFAGQPSPQLHPSPASPLLPSYIIIIIIGFMLPLFLYCTAPLLRRRHRHFISSPCTR